MPELKVIRKVLTDLDFAIKECEGGYLVVGNVQCLDGDDENSWTAAHVFKDEDEVCAWLLARLRWLKAHRN